MPRPTRFKIKFNDEDSANKLLQEIYNESHIIKANITRLFTKWEKDVKENGDIAAIGDTIIKLISAQGKNQDQKIMLLKFLKEVVYATKTNTKDKEDEGQQTITPERRQALIEMVEKGIHNKSSKN